MWESLNASIKVHLLITWDCYLFFYYKGKWKTLSDFGAVGSENAPKVFVSSNKTPSFIVSAASHLHPLSHGPTSLPSEKCTEQYKVAGSRSSLFLPELASHTAYLMSNWGAALTVRRGWGGGIPLRQMSRSPFIGCLICQPHTHVFSRFLPPSPYLHCLGFSPSGGSSSSISAAASVQKPHGDRVWVLDGSWSRRKRSNSQP